MLDEFKLGGGGIHIGDVDSVNPRSTDTKDIIAEVEDMTIGAVSGSNVRDISTININAKIIKAGTTYLKV
eukprot:14582956-Ditylum_brightwellii.AAC.1